MGMDVYGKKPKSKTGEYFRNSVWSWKPLWDFCLAMYPSVAGKVKNGHRNDGDGLNGRDAEKLAMLIEADLESGKVEGYKIGRNTLMEKIPLEECNLCQGTGKRDDEYVKGECNGCDGKGKRRQFLTWYFFDEENVKEWQKFLKDCGGFEIC